MKRTTLKIEEGLLRRMKEKAAREGKTLQDVANELLRRSLLTRRAPSFRLKLRGWKAFEQPGVDILDRDQLFDLMDGR